jgi:glucose-6-phosphate isomerase
MNADGRTRLNQTPEWTALAKHREELGEVRLRELFAADPGARHRLHAPGR